jgi:hypothetical protein
MIEIEDEYDMIVKNDFGQSLTSFLKIVWPEYSNGNFENFKFISQIKSKLFQRISPFLCIACLEAARPRQQSY